MVYSIVPPVSKVSWSYTLLPSDNPHIDALPLLIPRPLHPLLKTPPAQEPANFVDVQEPGIALHHPLAPVRKPLTRLA